MFLGNNETFNCKSNFGKQVFVVGMDSKGVCVDYEVYDNFEEAKKSYDVFMKNNRDKNYSYTLSKYKVKEYELDEIENYVN